MPGDNVVISHAGRRRRQRRRRLRRSRREDLRGARAAGRTAVTSRRSTTTSGTSRARTCSSRRSSASRTPTSRASTSKTSLPDATAAGSTSGTSSERTLDADRRPRRDRAGPARGALAARSGRGAGLRRRRPVEHDVALPSRQRRLGSAEQVIAVDGVELEGWPFPVPGLITDLRRLDGRPLPLLLELAARRPPPVRRLRPGATRS